ncbi:MAG: Zn-dependent hydrolase [Pseudomonadota bacterium]
MTALDRARRLFEELRLLGDDPPGVTRPSFSPIENAAHDLIRREAAELGLECGTDEVGNLYVALPGLDREAPVLMVGSHLDTVPHGGNFDGAAGVLAGFVLLERLAAGPRPPCDVVLMVIRAEEMIWFPEHYLGSRAAFGLLPRDLPERVRRSDTGRTLAEHMTDAGVSPQAIREGKAHLDPAQIRAFVEVHIEQGPVLLEAGLPVGVVTGIRGNLRHRFASITGQTTHAGGVPRAARRDAVLAGAELVASLESFWRHVEDRGGDMVLTFGEFTTDPAQHGITKVPGALRFTLDMRSQEQHVLEEFEDHLALNVDRICAERNVEIDLGPATRAPPAPMSEAIKQGLRDAAAALVLPYQDIPSGGGHDCAVFAGLGVPSGMIFIRNENGSHNPDEHMDFDDFACAADLLTEWARRDLF